MSLSGQGDNMLADEQHSPASGSRQREDVLNSEYESNGTDSGLISEADGSAGGPEVISEQEGSLDEEEETPDRPNKYRGPASTWRTYTEAERKLAESIDRQRATDLAIHLYNAHALKRRIRHPEGAAALPNWRSKERWRFPPGRSGQREDSAREDDFYPPKGWTAWPMKPELVPREGEKPVPRDFEAGAIYQSRAGPKDSKPSELLEEYIQAEMLKVVKEKFLQRKAEDVALERRNDGEGTPGPSQSGRRDVAASSRGSERRSSAGAGEEGFPSAEEMGSPPSHPLSNLVPMADDDEARKLLHPAIRHVLSKLDALLMGLHHAREAYLSSSSSDDNSNGQPKASETPQTPERGRRSFMRVSGVLRDSGVGATAKRGRGRPPKHPGIVLALENSPIKDPHKKRPGGRPRKYPKGWEKQQTYYMMRKLKNQGANAEGPSNLPGDKTPGEYEAESESEDEDRTAPGSDFTHLETSDHSLQGSSSSRVKKRRRTGDPVKKARYGLKRRAQLGARDWSDVLGMASMVGWDPDVVSRAAARCSALFGEGMQFRTLNEEDTFLKGARNGKIVDYRPDLISPLQADTQRRIAAGTQSGSESDLQDESGVLPDHIQARTDAVRGEGRESRDPWSPTEDLLLRSLKALRPPLSFRDLATYFPKRSMAACKSRWRWIQDEGEGEDSEDKDMIGGLHNDGFLKPIRRQRGWRGDDKRKRKIRRNEKGKGKAMDVDSGND